MPRTHVALLRGVNVGKAKRVAMADLRALVERLGHRDVRTLLNSGNVAFTAPTGTSGEAAGVHLERALAEQLGITSRVTVLSAGELGTVIAENPLLGVADDPSRLLVSVLADPRDRRRVEVLTRRDWAPEALAAGSRAAYLWLPSGTVDSPAVKALDRELGDAQTSRNWSTMLKLGDLLAAE